MINDNIEKEENYDTKHKEKHYTSHYKDIDRAVSEERIKLAHFNVNNDYDKNKDQLLIEELQKRSVQRGKLNHFKSGGIDKDEWSLVYMLKQIPGLLKFIKYNGIDDITLKEAVSNFRYLKVAKDDYIYRESEFSKRYYGIIKGKVSIRVIKKRGRLEKEINNTNRNDDLSKFIASPFFVRPERDGMLNESDNSKSNISLGFLMKLKTRSQREKNTSFSGERGSISKFQRSSVVKRFYTQIQERMADIEEELVVLTEGMCFGEWSMLYDTKPKNIAFALENCDLFFIDKILFDISFSRALTRAKNERKLFLQNVLPFLKKIPNSRFDQFFRKFVIVNFHKKNEIIYKQNDVANFLYIIYQGECVLKIDISKSTMDTNTEEDSGNGGRSLSGRDNRRRSGIGERSVAGSGTSTTIKTNDVNVNDIFNNKNFKNILLLSKGAICGLEISAGFDKLNNYLVSSTDDTVTLKIDVKNFEEFKNESMAFLLPLYSENKKIIENYVSSHINLKNQIKFNFTNCSGIKKSMRKKIININTTDNGQKRKTKENKEYFYVSNDSKCYDKSRTEKKSISYNQLLCSSIECFNNKLLCEHHQSISADKKISKIKKFKSKNLLEYNYSIRKISENLNSKNEHEKNIISSSLSPNQNEKLCLNIINSYPNIGVACPNSSREFRKNLIKVSRLTSKNPDVERFNRMKDNLIIIDSVTNQTPTENKFKNTFTFDSGNFNLPLVTYKEYKLNKNTQTSPCKK